MNVKDIQRQFSAVHPVEALPVSEIISSLAHWMASRADVLKQDDVALLVSLGSALHSVQLEQNWQRSWE